jgi:hypothetical protein
MIGLAVATRTSVMRARIAFSLSLLGFAGPALAQDLPVRNLGAGVVFLDKEWGVYSVWEAFAKKDLNGDGDTEDLVNHVQDLSSGETRNLGLAADFLIDPQVPVRSEDWIIFPVPESKQGTDLNGDGDLDDKVVHVHQLSSRHTVNLALAVEAPTGGRGERPPVLYFNKKWLALWVSESHQGVDLNDDDDSLDEVLHVRDLSSSETTNLRLARGNPPFDQFYEDWFVFWVSEIDQGKDITGDGDIEDRDIIHVHDFSRGETRNLRRRVPAGPPAFSGNLLLFTSDSPPTNVSRLYAHDLLSGNTSDLGASGYWGAFGNWAVRTVRERFREDLNGDGDWEDLDVVQVDDLVLGQSVNVGVDSPFWRSSEGRLLLPVLERAQGADLNGDGDSESDIVLHVYDPTQHTVTNLGLAGDFNKITRKWLSFSVSERQQGRDLNGDNDRDDENVVHVHEFSSGATRNLALAGEVWALSENWLVMGASEPGQGVDLDGDGRPWGSGIVHVHNLSSGATMNLGFNASFVDLFENRLVLRAHEGSPNHGDVNEDGDVEDDIVLIHDLGLGNRSYLRLAAGVVGLSRDWLILVSVEDDQREDLNGDLDRRDIIVLVHEFASFKTTNLRVAHDRRSGYSSPRTPLSERWLAIPVPEGDQGSDLNGDGDALDTVWHLCDLNRLSTESGRFLRADCNGDDIVNISDPVFALASLFLGEAEPACNDACDSNDDSRIDVSDAVTMLNVLFLGEGNIPLPGMNDCGLDPTEDILGCERAQTTCQ